MSEELIVVETVAGTQVIGKVDNNTEFDKAVLEGQPVVLRDVFKVVTVNMPVGPGNVIRITKLARMDFSEGPLPELTVNVSSYYRLTEEVVEKYVVPEIEDMKERAERPVDVDGLGEESPIVQARAVPVGAPFAGFGPRGR